MPSIRVGFSTDLNITGGLTGIGTTNPAARLDVAGQIVVEDTASSGGVSTFREYQGFSQVQAKITNNTLIDNDDCGPFSSLSGEIKITGETTVSSGSTVEVGKTKTLTATDRFAVPLGDTNSRDTAPEAGTIRFNQDFGTLEFFDGNNWKTVNSYARGGASGRTVIAGGSDSSNYKLLQSVQTTSLGNSTAFGELSLTGGYGGSAMSNGIRGLTGGGWDGANNNNVEYVTLASGGNGIDFGADTDQGWGPMGASTSTRGISAGGGYPSANTTIKSFFFSSTGVREDFGNLPTGIDHRGMGDKGPNSPTRGLFCGGYSVRRMESKELHSDGDTVLFGDLVSATRGAVSASDQTRGILFSGWDGASYIQKVDYVTMASFGNAVEFGDMDLPGYGASGGNMTRALYFRNNEIQYVEIQSQGNAVDFGDIGYNVSVQALGLQDSHGGLGGF